MKRIILIVSLVATLVLSAIPAAATPTNDNEVDAWRLEGSSWAKMTPLKSGGVSENAHCWADGESKVGACNKQTWTFDFTISASVAQWIEWSISSDRWTWRVRKPGTYAADCITATLKSNDDVVITGSYFDNLKWTGPLEGTENDTIEVWYAQTGLTSDPPAPNSTEWVTASQLNNSVTVPDSPELHSGWSWKLWNKIKVVECNSAGEYEDTGTITITLTNIKDWIDGPTGNFKPLS